MDKKRNPAEIVANAKQMLAANAQQYTRATLPGWLPGQDNKHDRLYKVFGLPEQLTLKKLQLQRLKIQPRQLLLVS